MKVLFTILLLLTVDSVFSQTLNQSVSIYTINKRYDTVASTTQLFNSHDRLTYESATGKGNKNQETSFSYNEDGSVAYGLTTGKNGDSTWHWHYYTDNKLTAQRTTTYNAALHQWEDTIVSAYTYNDAGNIIEEQLWHKKNEHGSIVLNTWNTNRRTYTYNNIGQLLTYKSYYIYSLNDWDKELLKTKTDRQQDTILLTSLKYEYKAKGYTRINYDINQIDPYDTVNVKYEFDKFDRIIKETERVKSILSGTVIRTYSYHPQKRIDREIYYDAADKLQRVKMYMYE